jgi:hypothetical protein
MNRFCIVVTLLLIAGCRPASEASRESALDCGSFTIEVLDAATGRGVPLVELRTTNDIRLYTDSNGIIAFREPGLMGRKVFVYVSSPGYDFPADGFGSKGRALDVVAGKSAKLEINRVNIAERLYRVTGQGIYRDSLLVGRGVPTKQPALNGSVMGQDSVYGVPYRGRVYWFWGDTNRPNHPLGNYAMSGATSRLPKDGGLDPSRGIDLDYFTDARGFSREMAPMQEPGLVWVDGVAVVQDTARNRARMVGSYQRLKKLGQVLERGIVAYDDATETFKPLRTLPLDARIYPRGHSLNVKVDGVDYVYFAHPYPLLRVRADWDHAIDPPAYEAFTCLKAGSRFTADKPALDRDADGKLVYAWKRNTDPVGPAEQASLIKSGAIEAGEGWINLVDVETNGPVNAHNGTVAWNAYRKRYVMIFTQIGGKQSNLGEVWYSEADAPQGPWRQARKIASHPDYSFYNPCHHPFFDQVAGRVIYFEGTYTAAFSSARQATPRYDYNQLMYRLDLSDPRLRLPAHADQP